MDGAEYPCAESLHPELSTYIDSFIRNKRWTYGDETTRKLHSMSLGTICLQRYARKKVEHVATLQLHLRRYSFWFPYARAIHGMNFRLDTVRLTRLHCGLLSGDLVYSLGLVDFATYWTEYIMEQGTRSDTSKYRNDN